MRRQKTETDLNLPPKKEIVIYAPVTELQHKLYMATLSKEMNTLLNKEPVILFYLRIAKNITHLFQKIKQIYKIIYIAS